ncbi:hypothetical protein D3C79_999820 [compost metagenome]
MQIDVVEFAGYAEHQRQSVIGHFFRAVVGNIVHGDVELPGGVNIHIIVTDGGFNDSAAAA